MDSEKKRMIALASIIILLIFSSIAYFIWANFLGASRLTITAKAPFTVEILGEKTYNCDESPCKIKTGNGAKTLLIKKEGYEQTIKNVNLRPGESEEVNIEFKIVPFLSKAANFPTVGEGTSYTLVMDSNNGMQKLVDESDNLASAIVYFQKQIQNPQIFSSKNTVLIIEKNSTSPKAYKVNTLTKSRELIEADFGNITDGSWSPNGKYFLFQTPDSRKLQLMKENGSIVELNLYSQGNIYTWTYSNTLLFVSQQDIGAVDTEVLETISYGSYIFGEYHPEENLYTKIKTITEIPEMPSVLIPTSNMKVIYFQAGGENLQLNSFL